MGVGLETVAVVGDVMIKIGVMTIGRTLAVVIMVGVEGSSASGGGRYSAHKLFVLFVPYSLKRSFKSLRPKLNIHNTTTQQHNETQRNKATVQHTPTQQDNRTTVTMLCNKHNVTQ